MITNMLHIVCHGPQWLASSSLWRGGAVSSTDPNAQWICWSVITTAHCGRWLVYVYVTLSLKRCSDRRAAMQTGESNVSMCTVVAKDNFDWFLCLVLWSRVFQIGSCHIFLSYQMCAATNSSLKLTIRQSDLSPTLKIHLNPPPPPPNIRPIWKQKHAGSSFGEGIYAQKGTVKQGETDQKDGRRPLRREQRAERHTNKKRGNRGLEEPGAKGNRDPCRERSQSVLADTAMYYPLFTRLHTEAPRGGVRERQRQQQPTRARNQEPGSPVSETWVQA